MKPKARQIVFLEYEQSGVLQLSDRYRENSALLHAITQVDDAICH
jgi:hypothetical protein